MARSVFAFRVPTYLKHGDSVALPYGEECLRISCSCRLNMAIMLSEFMARSVFAFRAPTS
jgi:hypothetical protein